MCARLGLGSITTRRGAGLAPPPGMKANGPRSSRHPRALVTVLALLLTSLWWIALPPPVQAGDTEVHALVKEMIGQSEVSFSGRLRLSSPSGMERILEVHHAQNADGGSTYMEVTAPYMMKGTRFLSFERNSGDDEHYTFVPVVRRSIQVPQWTLQQSFLGSTFYMIDIAVPDMKEFTYAFAGSATYENRPCRKVEATALRADYPYRKIVYCISPEIGLSLATEYFDNAEKLLKVWTAKRIEQIEGVWVPLMQNMENVQSGASSSLEIQEIRVHAVIPANVFTKAYLDR